MVQALEPRKWMHKHISVWRGLKDSSVWGVFKQSFSVVASNLLRQLAKGGGERLSILSCLVHSKIGNSLYYSPASPEIVIAARGKRRNLLEITEYLSLPVVHYSWYGPVKRLSQIRRLSSEFAMAAVGFVTQFETWWGWGNDAFYSSRTSLASNVLHNKLYCMALPVSQLQLNGGTLHFQHLYWLLEH